MAMTLKAAPLNPHLTTVQVPQTRSRANRRASGAVWTAQVLAALIFLMAGGSKMLMPADMLAAVSPIPVLFLRLLGFAELAGAAGLILPAALRIRPILTPIAAACLSVIVVGATVITVAGGDVAGAALPFITMLLTVFVTYGRVRLARVASRLAGRGTSHGAVERA
jgi:hypothetical protein